MPGTASIIQAGASVRRASAAARAAAAPAGTRTRTALSAQASNSTGPRMPVPDDGPRGILER